MLAREALQEEDEEVKEEAMAVQEVTTAAMHLGPLVWTSGSRAKSELLGRLDSSRTRWPWTNFTDTTA